MKKETTYVNTTEKKEVKDGTVKNILCNMFY